ncbi:methyltransferase family protein [Stakelama saccharophila]|uniref:Isoprenylcysteine carboxylmethyltransferase family protein n=1 Tax=Stakelama saccharophila TaxID=3075605 RepID=A0ABZ0B973_9SPHN|nr:isoprenylcysteine carboxylmethyltransferase family protein [Stakelama sp. W311]WNO53960.1 isoprenylcysteine carboxylmethyltransferase family protein [Stakelama sp. W311]
MFHDLALARRTAADPRPRSATSTGTGLVGIAGLLVWTTIATYYGMDGPYAALVNVAACGLPMVVWSILVDKVHRRPSTGIDWHAPRKWRETIDISMVKIAGLWLTWAGIAGIYAVSRFYWSFEWGAFPFAMWCFERAAPVLVILSVPYIVWLDRYLVAPRDGCWALGAWILGLKQPIVHDAIYNHLRCWAVKAFFLAFMLAIVPPGFGNFVRGDVAGMWRDPVALSNWLITFMFSIDVAFATVGYMLTMKPLDAHIRTANPYAAAWMAALICYPPFTLMGEGEPLDYHPGTSDWTHWFAGHPVLLAAVGATLVALTAIYAWATVAFGLRFSNLTHRGIITNGPYALSRHPAYLSKNLFWLLSTIPVLTLGSWTDAVRATVLMGVVAGVYYWRARTEERHLLADPDYRAYWDWMERNGPVPRLFAWMKGEPRMPASPTTGA